MSSLTDVDKTLAFSFIKYLNGLIAAKKLTEDDVESIEVARDCLQAIFDVNPGDPSQEQKYKLSQTLEGMVEKAIEADMTADSYKLEGTKQFEAGNYQGAIEMYSKAIAMDSSNATYYANRAAAYMYVQEYTKAKDDCLLAVEKNPKYCKAYHRLGRICVQLKETEDAKKYYKKAIELDPGNEKYKADLKTLEDPKSSEPTPQQTSSTSAGAAGGLDFGSLFSNPAFMNMATSMMQNPAVQSTLSQLASNLSAGQEAAKQEEAPSHQGQKKSDDDMVTAGAGSTGTTETRSTSTAPSHSGRDGSSTSSTNASAGTGMPGGMFGNLSSMMPQMQQITQQLQRDNPELVEQLRSQFMGGQPPPNSS